MRVCVSEPLTDSVTEALCDDVCDDVGLDVGVMEPLRDWLGVLVTLPVRVSDCDAPKLIVCEDVAAWLGDAEPLLLSDVVCDCEDDSDWDWEPDTLFVADGLRVLVCEAVWLRV